MSMNTLLETEYTLFAKDAPDREISYQTAYSSISLCFDDEDESLINKLIKEAAETGKVACKVGTYDELRQIAKWFEKLGMPWCIEAV